MNQANFFSETKTIKTRIALEEGAYEEQNYEVNTDFTVYLKDKTQLKDNDYLNKASLVILNSTMTSNEGEQELPSFDIYDKKKVGEFESFPDGSKFPISSFSFYENGTIVDIKFPEFTDEYNGQILKELVEKVIPKLSRNRTEDNANGLNIKTRTDRKKKTLIEEEKPQQYLSFKGSKFSRTVQRDFEDDKLTDIKSKSDIVLVSTPEEDEKVFGVKEFYFQSESNIILKEIKEGLIELGNILRRFNINFDLINNHDLLEIEDPNLGQQSQINTYGLIKQAKRRKGDQGGDGEGDEDEDEDDGERRLGYSISADQTFNIGKYNVLGQTVTVKYHVAVKNGKPINEIIIDSKLGTTTIGNTGVSLKGSWSKTITIFKFAFPAFPLVSINAKAKGTISWAVSVTSGSGSSVKLSASLGGTISLGCEVKAGWDAIVSFSGGVEGVIVSATGSATIENKKVTKNFSISGGKIVVYLDRDVFGKKKRVAEKTLFNGW